MPSKRRGKGRDWAAAASAESHAMKDVQETGVCSSASGGGEPVGSGIAERCAAGQNTRTDGERAGSKPDSYHRGTRQPDSGDMHMGRRGRCRSSNGNKQASNNEQQHKSELSTVDKERAQPTAVRQRPATAWPAEVLAPARAAPHRPLPHVRQSRPAAHANVQSIPVPPSHPPSRLSALPPTPSPSKPCPVPSMSLPRHDI
nr:hypothetical protein CFP56_30171 [Quercus suber]